MIAIDAHQHFWSPVRGDYGWMEASDDLAPLRRDYLPQHLAPLLESLAIDRTVLVQAAPTIAETAFLLDLASEHELGQQIGRPGVGLINQDVRNLGGGHGDLG